MSFDSIFEASIQNDEIILIIYAISNYARLDIFIFNEIPSIGIPVGTVALWGVVGQIPIQLLFQ
jgi:hypothetical protein